MTTPESFAVEVAHELGRGLMPFEEEFAQAMFNEGTDPDCTAMAIKVLAGKLAENERLDRELKTCQMTCIRLTAELNELRRDGFAEIP